MHTLQSVHTAGDDVRGASLRPRQPKGTLPTSGSANNFCRRASGAPWYVRNDILHRDLELPISKYMQDMSKSSSTQLLTIPTHYYKQPYPTSLPLHITSSEGHGMSFQTHRTNSPLRSKG
ncbi:hypothetical protein EVAR_96326_1 [Eumeta japonica]|uniref:Uncharacterized protein n=1 Tax=Eumeta variegata TaxID=151549 RepID=A0A4C1VYQ2_EUMVA|nr:hypothetical protein EVAR_96326_1 [Eumeta japonica]